MANTEIIDQVVDPVTLKQVTDLQASLVSLDKTFVDTAKDAVTLNNIIANSKGFTDFNAKAQQAAIANEKLQQAQNKTVQSSVSLEKAQLSLANQHARTAAQQEKATQAAQKALSPYQQLSKQLDQLRAHAKDVGAEFGKNSEQFKNASRPVQELDERLKGIDQTLGQSQRNVGNYGNAFKGVLTQYIPFGDATLRVGENLKTLAGDIGKSEEGLGELAAGFLGFSSAAFVAAIASAVYYLTQFKSTANAVNEFLSGGKNILGSFGENIVNFFKSPSFKSLDKILPSTQELIAQAAQGAGEEQTRIALKNKDELEELSVAQLKAESEKYRALSADRKLDIADRISYIKSAQGIENEILMQQKENADKTIEGAIQLGNKYGTLRKSQIKRLNDGDVAYAQELAEKGQQFTEEGFELYKKGIQKRIAYQSGAANQIIQLQTDADNMQLRDDHALALAREKTLKDRLEGELLTSKLIIENDNKNYETKLQASKTFEEKSIALAQLQRKQDIYNAGIAGRAGADKRITDQLKIDAEVVYQNTIKKILDEGQKQRQGIEKAETERQKKNLQDLLAANKGLETETIANLQDSANKQLTVLEDQFDKEAALLDDRFAKNKLTQKQYNDDIIKLEDQYNVDRLGQEVFLQQQILEVKEAALANDIALAQNRGASPDTIKEIVNKSGVSQQQTTVAKAGTALSKGLNKQSADDAKIDAEKLKTFQKEFAQDAQEAAKATELAQQAEDAHYQNQIDLLEQKKTLLQDTAKVQIDAVNKSIQSEADKQRKINIINKQLQIDQERIAEQQRQIKQRQARADKAANIIKVIEGTAVAVVEALPNYILAAVVGAIGAAELALVASQPIPQYKDGGFTKPGLSIWGEAGVELAREPSGKTYFSPDRATLAAFPVGTEIIPNHMIRPEVLNYTGGQQVPWRDMIKAINGNKPKEQKRPVVKIQVNNDSLIRRMSR